MKFLIKAMLILSIGSAYAETTNGGYAGCFLESDYDQMVGADKRLFNHLIKNNRCAVIASGFNFSILDRGWLSSKIKLYVGDHAIDMYVPNEMIK